MVFPSNYVENCGDQARGRAALPHPRKPIGRTARLLTDAPQERGFPVVEHPTSRRERADLVLKTRRAYARSPRPRHAAPGSRPRPRRSTEGPRVSTREQTVGGVNRADFDVL